MWHEEMPVGTQVDLRDRGCDCRGSGHTGLAVHHQKLDFAPHTANEVQDSVGVLSRERSVIIWRQDIGESKL
jgi:hypothetical protein